VNCRTPVWLEPQTFMADQLCFDPVQQ